MAWVLSFDLRLCVIGQDLDHTAQIVQCGPSCKQHAVPINCNGLRRKTISHWHEMFKQLKAAFPTTKVSSVSCPCLSPSLTVNRDVVGQSSHVRQCHRSPEFKIYNLRLKQERVSKGRVFIETSAVSNWRCLIRKGIRASVHGPNTARASEVNKLYKLSV